MESNAPARRELAKGAVAILVLANGVVSLVVEFSCRRQKLQVSPRSFQFTLNYARKCKPHEDHTISGELPDSVTQRTTDGRS